MTILDLPQLCAREPFGGVTVQTDHMLPGVVGGKSELALAAVHLCTNLIYTCTQWPCKSSTPDSEDDPVNSDNDPVPEAQKITVEPNKLYFLVNLVWN